MAVTRKLDFKDFDLQKVKANSDGVHIEFYEKGNGNLKHTVDCSEEPHPDFITSLKALQLYFAMRIGILDGWNFARENLKKDQELLKDAISGYDSEIERCSVFGIAYVGSDQLRAVKITGALKCKNGSVGMATPNITFSSDKLGYEDDVKDLCDVVMKECYNYAFKNKRAQQDIMTQIEEQDEQSDN